MPRGSVKALDDVSMSVGAGDFVSIMGPSGSGKSTLLNIIGCLDTPTSGEVFIGGARVSGLSDDELTRLRLERMGFVFQHFNLIPTLTALENVEFPMLLRGMREREAKERGKQLLRAVGLDEGSASTSRRSSAAASNSELRLRGRSQTTPISYSRTNLLATSPLKLAVSSWTSSGS